MNWSGVIRDQRTEKYNEVYTVGSAVKAGNAMVTIKEGYEAALKL